MHLNEVLRDGVIVTTSFVHADLVQWQQVILKLLKNAFRDGFYAQQGRQLDISTRIERNRFVSCPFRIMTAECVPRTLGLVFDVYDEAGRHRIRIGDMPHVHRAV